LISFAQIVDIVDATVQKLGGNSPISITSLADVSAVENDSRIIATQLVQERK